MPEYLDKFKSNKFELPTAKYGSYTTNREGFRSFTIEYTKDSIKIYSNTYLNPIYRKDENIILQKFLKEKKYFEMATYFDDNTYFFPKTSFVMEINNFNKVWLGFDKELPKYIGNTILVQIKSDKYIYIEDNGIYGFTSNEEILKFYSPLDDETVPCPVAFTKNKLIFLLEKEAFDRKLINDIVMSTERQNDRKMTEVKNSPPIIYNYLYYNYFFDDLEFKIINFIKLDSTDSVNKFINADITYKNNTKTINKKIIFKNIDILFIIIIVLIIIGFIIAGVYITHLKHKIL